MSLIGFPHRVKIVRPSWSVDGSLKSTSTKEVLYSSMKCLLEPLSSKKKEIARSGKFEEAQLQMSWPAVYKVEEGDEAVFEGKVYVVGEIQEDTLRPFGIVHRYGTGILEFSRNE